ncbi:MAG: hypothetical protein HC897_16195 [Thermoanaerobaculia bacterium]|nr:hypothetical protein [Thermoanaerobaculia bacterium]
MNEKTSANRPIFVLGIDRSGTSLLSEVIGRWGASAGAADLLCRADDGNPQGYWEYKPMQDFFSDLANSVGFSIWHPDFKRAVAAKADDPRLVQKARELAAEMGPANRPWFWKDTLLITNLPFVRRVFPDALYFITLRNPWDSAISYEKLRIPASLKGQIRLCHYTLHRWQHLMIEIFQELKDYRGKLLVPFESLISAPAEQCVRVHGFLRRELGPSPDDAQRLEAMVQTIDPRLWRNDSGVAFLDRDDASPAQKRLYSYLSSRLDGDTGDFDAAEFPFPEWSSEYCSNVTAMQWLLGSL